MKVQKCHHRYPSGFTLVVTLMMMVLLTVVVVGMLSLSTVSLRSTVQTNSQAVARANARLALMIAIGHLQKTAGPDRRVTASADIIKSCDPAKKHWTGVWSTEGWEPRLPQNRTFVSWLTSDTEAMRETGEAALSLATKPLIAPSEDSRRVKMVGEGTLGTDRSDEKVEVYTMPVHAGGKQTGGFAYWVGDEGIKARYDLAEPETEQSDEIYTRWAAPARLGIHKIDGMERYEGLPREKVSNAISFNTIGLAQGQRVPDGLFHDVSTNSEGLIVDVRNGGARRDLSLAFELPADEFNALFEFHDSNETNDTNWYNTLSSSTYGRSEFYPSNHKLGYVFQVPIDQARLRGPTWDLLRNHSRLYKKEWESFSWARKQGVSSDAVEARGSLPMSYAAIRNPDWSIGARWGEFSNEGRVFGKPVKVYNESVSRHQPYSTTFNPNVDILRHTAEKIAPIVTRVTFVLGLAKGNFPFLINVGTPSEQTVTRQSIAVSMDPYFTICNPYNRPIEFYSIGFFSSKFNPFNFELGYRAPAGSWRSESFNSSENVYNQGSFSFRLDPATTGGKMRLEPGEIRVISPRQVLGGTEIARKGATPLAGTKEYQEDSGIVIPPKNPLLPAAGTSITFSARGRDTSSGNEADSLTFSLFLPKLHNGQSRDVVMDLPPVANVQINTDAMDDPLIQRLGFSTLNYPTITKTVNSSQIPRAGEAGLYVAALDMWIKDFASGDRPVLAQFNPRASAVDPRDYDGTHRVSPAWSEEFVAIDDISELGLATAYGLARWGGGTGSANSNGTSYLCLYDIPRAPLTSLASFQHADLGGFATDAPYAIGNSFPPPSLALDSIAGTMGLDSSQYTDWSAHSHMDVSWAANEMLWDRYFLSGLAWGTGNGRYDTLDDAVDSLMRGRDESPFANPRMQLAAKPTDEDLLKKHDTIGDQLSIRGAFNINSTSVNAWKAVLAGLDQVELTHLSNGSVRTSRFNIPVSRFSMPAGGPTDEYRGFRSLNDQELESLAEAIVEEVRNRGPFMGLSDFVNRRLESGENARMGALQAAISRSRINSNYTHAPTASNVPNDIDSTEAGIPGYVMQSDLLTQIGSFISARSDTFKIRAYGEATDAAGKVLARVWCEAIAQRTPEWMEPTSVPATIPNLDYPAGNPPDGLILRPYIPNERFPELNSRMGRRFKLTSFRWLSPDEV